MKDKLVKIRSGSKKHGFFWHVDGSSDHFLSGDSCVCKWLQPLQDEQTVLQLEVKVHHSVQAVAALSASCSPIFTHLKEKELSHNTWLPMNRWVSGEFSESLRLAFRCSAERHAFAVLLHQRHQAARGAGLQQEWVLEQLGGAGALPCVTSQHAAQEVLQHGRHLNNRVTSSTTGSYNHLWCCISVTLSRINILNLIKQWLCFFGYFWLVH